jgi:hypothetical protein
MLLRCALHHVQVIDLGDDMEFETTPYATKASAQHTARD